MDGKPEAELTIALTPQGHLLLAEDLPGVDAAAGRRLRRAFADGAGQGLLQLGAAEVTTRLPPDLAFFRGFARRFVATVCGIETLEAQREKLSVPFPGDPLGLLLASAPPLLGGEYLSLATLASLWEALLEAFRAEVAASALSVQALLAQKHPAWNVVGRVHLHLAENKRDEAFPFAFLATYTTGVTAQGKAQHRPLGEALRESSAAHDTEQLLKLLAPVQRATVQSAFLKELVDSGRIYAPVAVTPSDAYRFLQDVPVLEASGLVVRVPNWWKAQRAPRPKVTLSVGKQEPGGVGVDALLDFKVQLTALGETLSEAELAALRSGPRGLRLLRGQWIELDPEKLTQALAHWKEVEAHVGEESAGTGLSFGQAMRLLAGAPIGALGDEEAPADLATREWVGVESGAWLTETLRGMRAEGPTADPGPALKGELRPYQRAGVQWLWFLARLGLGACLADDMGLGKTIQVLALLLILKREGAIAGPHLLVAPASLLANWTAEAARFAPSLGLRVAHPSVLRRDELAALEGDALAGVDLVVTSYGTLSRLPWLSARQWGVVVLDEAQAIKNPGVKQTRAVKALKARARIALTGTPVENRVGDLWSLFDFLNPGLLGGFKEFGRFVQKSESHGPLRELTRPYLLRRLKTDRAIAPDLPEKTEVQVFCPLEKPQLALYQAAVEELSAEIAKAKDLQRKGVVLAYLTRFKQICNHPSQWLGDDAYAPADSGKFLRLRELCETIGARQEKALVFTQFRAMTLPLTAYLETLFGRPGLVLSGETPVKQRAELVRAFQEDERIPFFVLSLKAGARA